MRKVFLAIALILATAVVANAQTTRSYTLEFNHDGVNTDSYVVSVDGVRQTITPACVGTGDARLCTSQLPLTVGTNHTVVVIATNVFGEASSDPFVCSIPGKSVNVKVGR